MLLNYSFVAIFVGLLLFLYFLTKKQLSFSKRVFLALVMGVALGGLMQWIGHGREAMLFHQADNWFQFVGQGYLGLLKVLVVPLILTSIIQSIIRLDTNKDNLLGKLAWRSVAMLLLMTGIASAIGLAIGHIMHIGDGLILNDGIVQKHISTDLPHTLLGMVPTNLVDAMVRENTIALAIFAILLGLSAQWLRRTDSAMVEPFARFTDSIFHITKKLTQLVICLTPYGILALMVTFKFISRHPCVICYFGLFYCRLYCHGISDTDAFNFGCSAWGHEPGYFFKKSLSGSLDRLYDPIKFWQSTGFRRDFA